MYKKTYLAAKLIELAQKLGFLRVNDLLAHGIHHEYLRRLCTQGVAFYPKSGALELVCT